VIEYNVMTTKRELNWKPLYGLGKGIWKGEDAQDYVDRPREDRELGGCKESPQQTETKTDTIRP
jgi:hypothetical protein